MVLGKYGAQALSYRSSISVILVPILSAVVGWFVDEMLGTCPLFLVILFFLGGIAGVFSAYYISIQNREKQILT